MGDNSFLKFEAKELIKDKNEVTLSHLYAQILNDKLSFSEQILICHILKEIAIREDIVIPNMIFSNKLYVDFTKKEEPEKFGDLLK